MKSISLFQAPCKYYTKKKSWIHWGGGEGVFKHDWSDLTVLTTSAKMISLFPKTRHHSHSFKQFFEECDEGTEYPIWNFLSWILYTEFKSQKMHLIGISSLHILNCNFLKNFTFLLFLHWTLCIVIHMKDLFTHFWYDLIDENLEGKICPGKLVMMDTNFTKKLLFLMHFYLTTDQS